MTRLHRKLFSFLVATTAVFIATSTDAVAGLFKRSHAVVIGIDQYPDDYWPSLSYARKDALGMAQFLERQGFEVITLLNEQAKRADIIEAISGTLASKIREGDRVLLFFSGHGETREFGGRKFGYIVPHDGAQSVSSMISMAEMREISRQLGAARHQLFIFDSCYGGQLAVPRKGPLSSVPESHPRYIEKISANSARQYITAGGEGEVVLANGPKGYSYFTGYLLEALEGAADLNGDSYITSSELDAYLKPRASNWDHTPIAGVMPEHGQGNFWFRVQETTGNSERYERIVSNEYPSPLPPRPLSVAKKGSSVNTETLERAAYPVTEIEGIGPVLAKKFNEFGITTVGQLANLTDQQVEDAELQERIGKNRLKKLWQRAKDYLNQ